MTNDELDLDEALNLLDKPATTRTPKVKSDSGNEERTLRNWFDKHHTNNKCEVKTHVKISPHLFQGLTSKINGVCVCRECYLHERDRDG